MQYKSDIRNTGGLMASEETEQDVVCLKKVTNGLRINRAGV